MPGARDPYLARLAHIGRLPGAAVAVLALLIAATARFDGPGHWPCCHHAANQHFRHRMGTTSRILRNAQRSNPQLWTAMWR